MSPYLHTCKAIIDSGSGDGAVEIPEVIDSVDYTMSSSDGSFEMR